MYYVYENIMKSIMKIRNKWMQNKLFKWEISIVLEGEKTRKNRTWCYTIFKYLSHYGFKSTWYLLKTISKIQNHSINYFKRRVMRHFFRKYCYMKIVLHFGIIGPLKGPFWCVEVCFEVFEIFYVSHTHT